ncbi:hypothetical protein PM082_004886 [Marasmius tenuissimus]|nr:hypothetical protein PM082_004886 [Marasmius tenuissimus]
MEVYKRNSPSALFIAFLSFLSCGAIAYGRVLPRVTSGTLVVDDSTGVELAYLDSGAPSSNAATYTTIFTVHGMIFTNKIFEKILEIAPSKGVRLVAVQRRPFPGSTPFTPEELQITLTGGSSDEERAAYAEARGHELANFIDRFIQQFQLPAITANGQGGSVVWGWSIGALLPVWAIGNAKTLPADVQTRLGANLRSLILYEMAPLVLGLPMPPQNWSPLVDESVVENRRLQLFAQWSTGYFTHNDTSFSLETPHDPELLEWVLHTPTVVPTVYNIPVAEFNNIASFGDDAQTDLPILFFFAKDLKNAFDNSFKDQETASIFPKMKRGIMQGSLGPAFGAAGVWAVQDEVANSPIEVSYQIVDGGNHYFIWDNPEKTLAALLNIA